LYDHQFLASRPPLPEEGPINAEPTPIDTGAPEACENQDGNEAEGSLEGSDSTLLLPLAESEAQGAEKKRKCMEKTSSGTSSQKDVTYEQTTFKGFDLDIFKLLDS
jgi:hypothetical protein